MVGGNKVVTHYSLNYTSHDHRFGHHQERHPRRDVNIKSCKS